MKYSNMESWHWKL